MKKIAGIIISIILVLILMISLTGCGIVLEKEKISDLEDGCM